MQQLYLKMTVLLIYKDALVWKQFVHDSSWTFTLILPRLFSTNCRYKRLFFHTRKETKLKTKKEYDSCLILWLSLHFPQYSVWALSLWAEFKQNPHPCNSTVKLFCGCSCNPHSGAALTLFWQDSEEKWLHLIPEPTPSSPAEQPTPPSILPATWVHWILVVSAKLSHSEGRSASREENGVLMRAGTRYKNKKADFSG